MPLNTNAPYTAQSNWRTLEGMPMDVWNELVRLVQEGLWNLPPHVKTLLWDLKNGFLRDRLGNLAKLHDLPSELRVQIFDHLPLETVSSLLETVGQAKVEANHFS
jgi:hypothetical protein